MKTALVVLALAITVAVIGLVALAGAFSHQIVAREARLTSAPPEARRNDLPEAVHAFAERGLAGAAPARALHYRWQAAIRREKGGGWMELGATQVFAVAEPKSHASLDFVPFLAFGWEFQGSASRRAPARRRAGVDEALLLGCRRSPRPARPVLKRPIQALNHGD